MGMVSLRMALARSLDAGVLYPPLFDGRNYGGTRIMPLSILLHASAARLTGEYVMSGRLLSCFILLVLAVVIFRVLRDLQCPSSLAAILAASLTMRKRNGVWLFAATYVVLVSTLIGATSVVSAGRFFENFFGLSMAGIDGIRAALHSPTHLVRTVFGNTPALWALVPFVVLGLAINLARGEASIYDISLICYIPLLFLIFADIGAGDHHLLDLAVLGVLVIGHASSSLSRALDERSAVPRQLRSTDRQSSRLSCCSSLSGSRRHTWWSSYLTSTRPWRR